MIFKTSLTRKAVLNPHSFLLILFHSVQEDHPIMSFTVSKNGRLALLNVATQVLLFTCWFVFLYSMFCLLD